MRGTTESRLQSSTTTEENNQSLHLRLSHFLFITLDWRVACSYASQIPTAISFYFSWLHKAGGKGSKRHEGERRTYIHHTASVPGHQKRVAMHGRVWMQCMRNVIYVVSLTLSLPQSINRYRIRGELLGEQGREINAQ
jgi:hypothetical protein